MGKGDARPVAAEQAVVSDPVREEPEHPVPQQVVKDSANVHNQNPVDPPLYNPGRWRIQRIMRAAPGAEPEAEPEEFPES